MTDTKQMLGASATAVFVDELDGPSDGELAVMELQRAISQLEPHSSVLAGFLPELEECIGKLQKVAETAYKPF